MTGHPEVEKIGPAEGQIAAARAVKPAPNLIPAEMLR